MADHLSDEEQLEALKKWWKANGVSLLVAIVLVAGGWFGWNYYKAQKQQQAEQASLVYMAMLDAVGKWEQDGSDDEASVAAAHAETLKKLGENNEYGLIAAMTIARLSVADNELDNATAELEWVLSHTEDQSLKGVVTYRLAALEYNRGNSDRALSLLTAPHPGTFEGIYGELEGDILASKGDNEAASAAYKTALDSLDVSDNRARAMLELKMNELAPVSDDASGVTKEDT